MTTMSYQYCNYALMHAYHYAETMTNALRSYELEALFVQSIEVCAKINQVDCETGCFDLEMVRSFTELLRLFLNTIKRSLKLRFRISGTANDCRPYLEWSLRLLEAIVNQAPDEMLKQIYHEVIPYGFGNLG